MDHRARFRDEADRFCELVATADPATPVPACPGWVVSDLAFHLGSTWDWFHQIVSGRLVDKEDIRSLVRLPRPDDDRDLPEWVRTRADALLTELAGLDDDEPLWNFTRAPHVGAWLARRMHHETGVHRWDLEEACGHPTPPAPDVARDGIDELLTVLSTAGRRWEGDRPAVLAVATDDTGWQIRLEPGERAVPAAPADPVGAQLTGPATDVFLALWRRRPLGTVAVAGDPELAARVLSTIGR